MGLPPLKSVLSTQVHVERPSPNSEGTDEIGEGDEAIDNPSGGGSMTLDVDGIAREIEVLDRYAERLRQQIDAAQKELARVTRKKQQLIAEISRLKKAWVVTV